MLTTIVFSWIILPIWAVGMGALLLQWHYRKQQEETAVPLLIRNQQ